MNEKKITRVVEEAAKLIRRHPDMSYGEAVKRAKKMYRGKEKA